MGKKKNSLKEKRLTKMGLRNVIRGGDASLQIAGIETESIVDGPGIRLVIYFSGCTHNCKNCHATELQDFSFGESLSIDELLHRIKPLLKYCDGITLSGGDPVFQLTNINLFLEKFKKLFNLNVFMYTGFEFGQLDVNKLKFIDYIMDGKYCFNLPTKKQHRGSDNQHLYANSDDGWVLID